MTRYFITHQTLSYNCGFVRVDMKSSTAQHLWLLYTVHEPSIAPQPDIQQPGTKPHHNNYRTFIDGVVEQDEPGATNQHTFHFALPPASGIVWFYTINMGIAGLKATRSPIFAYEFTRENTWSESWLPGPRSEHFFQFSYNPGFNPITAGLNSLNIVSRAVGVIGVITGVASLGNEFGDVIGPFDSCGALFTCTLPSNDGNAGYGSPYVYLRMHSYAAPSADCGLLFKTGGPLTVPQETAPPVNIFAITCPVGTNTFSINELLRIRHIAYPTSCPPGLVSVTKVEVAGGTHSPQFGYIHQYPFGPLSLDRVQDAPKDVSKFWRSKPLSPTLR